MHGHAVLKDLAIKVTKVEYSNTVVRSLETICWNDQWVQINHADNASRILTGQHEELSNSD